MATSDSDSGIASDSDFDPAQYEPAVLQYEPIGLKLYNPGDVAYEPEVVLREPNKHLSVYNRETKSYVRGYGGSGNVKEFYNALPPETKKLVDGTGFKGFIDILGETSNDHVQLTALAERWCDTTNTLHLSFGEATLTPLDFAAITGIRVGGKLIPYDMKLFKKHSALEYFLGRVPKKISDAGTVKYTWFYECFQNDMKTGRVYATKQEFEQLARSFLLYMFGAALFSNKDSRVHLHYLGAMNNLAAVKDYDWGGAALATLYGHMSVTSRSKKPSMGGYWRVWEGLTFSFSFTYLFAFPFTFFADVPLF